MNDSEKRKECNSRQIGGNHYRTGDGEQHWDRIWRLYGRGYFVGNITKYVERYHLKNGIEDLLKAQHYLDKLIELEVAAQSDPNKQETTNESLALPTAMCPDGVRPGGGAAANDGRTSTGDKPPGFATDPA